MRKQLHYVTLALLFFNTSTLSAENYVDLYINTYKDIAIQEMMRSGIPASITLAQGIHESSWGKGELALNSNNHFGIKCKDYWQGPSFYYEDDDYDRNGKLMKSCFRAYENPEKSYIDHTDFLVSTAHYQELFSYSSTDYQRWAKGLKKCGYATDKEYANKLIRTIEKYQLYKFDLPKEEPMLASAPRYNIPKESVGDLLIRAEKKQETQIEAEVDYTIMNIPPAVRIPDDYQRRPKENAKAVFVNTEMPQQDIQTSKSVVIKEILPTRIKHEEYSNKPISSNDSEPIFHEQTSNSKVVNMKKESVIPAAFASTKRSYHLIRKPRTENTSLRQ